MWVISITFIPKVTILARAVSIVVILVNKNRIVVAVVADILITLILS